MKAINLFHASALALAVAACGTSTTSDSRELVDTFVVGPNTLEVAAVPLDNGSFDVAIGYTTDSASYGASFNLGDADLAANDDLLTLLSQLDEAVLTNVNETLRARETPATEIGARWLETERAIFGYADHGEETEYKACFWDLGQYEYCGNDGLYHCCVFDHGCSWLCATL